MKKIRSYSDLIALSSFESRFEYLSLTGLIGVETFGYERYLNQKFYKSPRWRRIRDEVVTRDFGCDLGISSRVISGILVVHHMNPILPKDFYSDNPLVFEPEYLILTSVLTHRAIHFGKGNIPISAMIRREKGDTKLW